MATKKELILVASDSMASNKKPDRDEAGLIRLSAAARKHLGFEDSAQVSGKAGNVDLGVFHAFSADIKEAKEKFSADEMKRVAFVTPETFRHITGRSAQTQKSNIWIAKTVSDILIGSDPEFLLFEPGTDTIVHANNHMGKHGPVGNDGAMIEVRPDPSKTPKGVVNNIKSILGSRKLMRPVEDFDWRAGVYYRNQQRDYPIGGHIHIGNPASINKVNGDRRSFMFAVFNKIIDELLAVPMVKLDGQDLGERRRSKCQMAFGQQGYGFYGEWRHCDGRLEHRTLSGLWLMHPDLAEAVLGTAKAISEELFNRVIAKGYKPSYFRCPGLDMDDHRYLYRADFDDWGRVELAKDMRCTKPSSEMRTILNSSRTSAITSAFLKKWHKGMKGMSTYKKYSDQIDKLYSYLCMSKKDIARIGTDLKANWVK